MDTDIVSFGAILVACYGMGAAELQYYYERPDKWTYERDNWIAAGRPDIFDVDAHLKEA